jgi:hypothetical protein
MKQASGAFLKKSAQKTSSIGVPDRGPRLQWMKSFFASFCSQKEDLALARS